MARRDRTGEPIEDEARVLDVVQLRHDLSCRNGWLGEDAAGRPIPCRLCRPHLRRRRRARRLRRAP